MLLWVGLNRPAFCYRAVQCDYYLLCVHYGKGGGHPVCPWGDCIANSVPRTSEIVVWHANTSIGSKPLNTRSHLDKLFWGAMRGLGPVVGLLPGCPHWGGPPLVWEGYAPPSHDDRGAQCSLNRKRLQPHSGSPSRTQINGNHRCAAERPNPNAATHHKDPPHIQWCRRRGRGAVRRTQASHFLPPVPRPPWGA